MDLLTPALRAALIANGRAAADRDGRHDPAPILKLFNPAGAATWLATELDPDGDIAFGLADLGFGCPELGYFSLPAIAAVRLPFGLRIERDLHFASAAPLSVWADTARRAGSILSAQARLADYRPRPARPADDAPSARAPEPDPLPPSDAEGG